MEGKTVRFAIVTVVIVINALFLTVPLSASVRRAPAKPEPLPFWRQKQKVYKRMMDERLIVVSAKTEKKEKQLQPYTMDVKAAGIVNAPFEYSRKWMTEFEKLPKVDSRFERVHYDKTNEILFLRVAAYGFYAQMWMKMEQLPGEQAYELHWENIRGSFTGMTGIIRVDKVNDKQSEVSLRSLHKSRKIPLPPVLMNFGLEFVGQRVSAKMRSYIEEEYRKSLKNNKEVSYESTTAQSQKICQSSTLTTQ
jgi:hypothetical protein